MWLPRVCYLVPGFFSRCPFVIWVAVLPECYLRARHGSMCCHLRALGAGESRVQGQFELYSSFEASLENLSQKALPQQGQEQKPVGEGPVPILSLFSLLFPRMCSMNIP